MVVEDGTVLIVSNRSVVSHENSPILNNISSILFLCNYLST